MTIPKKIKIRREKGYHTDQIGKCQNGDQFMAFIVAAGPENNRTLRYLKYKWYAVVHRFDRRGDYLGTESAFLGKAVCTNELEVDAEGWLAAMVKGLGKVKYCDIKIGLFSTLIDGHRFGLIDASVPKDAYVRVDLVPNDLAFFPPWDGYYDT